MPFRVLYAIAAFVCGSSLLAACGGGGADSGTFVPPKAGKRGLPGVPAGKRARGQNDPFEARAGYDLPFLPLTFSINDNLDFTVEYNGKLVTPIGTFHLSAEGDLTSDRDRPLPPEPGDVSQLVICRDGPDKQPCQAFKISTGRRLHIVMNGNFIQDAEPNRILIHAGSGSKITVSDAGPPAPVGAHGPARIAIEETDFNETSAATDVDLERRKGGTSDDLSYDHITGKLALIGGAKISQLARYREKSGSWVKDAGINLGKKIPGENECLQTPQAGWKSTFTDDDLKADTIITCVKTAEGEIGYLVIGRDRDRKPVAYHVYSYVWVR